MVEAVLTWLEENGPLCGCEKTGVGRLGQAEGYSAFRRSLSQPAAEIGFVVPQVYTYVVRDGLERPLPCEAVGAPY